MIRVTMLDDHELVRKGFVELLNYEHDIDVVYHCASIFEQINWLRENTVDVLITDLSLKQESGMDLLEHEVLTQSKMTKPIVLSMNDNDPFVATAIEKGAKGFLSKSASPEELATAIRQVHSGQRYLCNTVMNNLRFNASNNYVSKIKTLTPREREVFDCLAKGMEVKRVAKQLNIAPKTAHVHRANLMRKLELQTSFDLTKLALKYGLLKANDLLN